jgi:hypothetical protein
MEQQFEELLKQKTYDYRMYPSSNVWTGIHNHLHGKQKLALGALVALLVVTALLFNNDTKNSQNQKTAFVNENTSISYSYSPLTSAKHNTSKNLYNKSYNTGLTPLVTGEDNATNTITEVYSLTEMPNQETIRTYKPQLNSENNAITNENVIEDNQDIATVDDNNFETNETIGITENKVQLEFPLVQPIVKNLFDNNSNKEIATAQNVPIKISTRKARVRAQYYITPSLSYRTLLDERKPTASSLLVGGGNQDIDKAVAHKPSFGVETGVNWLVLLESKLRLRTGMQINYNRYSIKASTGQPELTTIALNGSSNITNVSTLRNTSNTNKLGKWLDNSSLQLAIPIGVELDVLGNKNVQFTVGTSIQPSVVLRNKMYLLSTDFKSYVEESSLARRFNVTGAFETFVTFSTKKTRWQIGPQLRYQFLSTYDKAYPIKENLFDYGFKIGVSKPF